MKFLYSNTGEQFWMKPAHKPPESLECHWRHDKDKDVFLIKKASCRPRSKYYWTLQFDCGSCILDGKW